MMLYGTVLCPDPGFLFLIMTRTVGRPQVWQQLIAHLDINMEIIWSLMLTVCMDSQSCIQQTVQWFDEKNQCFEMKMLHEELPVDGHWKTINYKCTIVGAKEV